MVESCCTAITASARDQNRCPGCAKPGRTVATATVQAQVAISLRELAAGNYHFCATAQCPIVYFTVGGHLVRKEQLRERVFQKEQAGDVLVCYCFRYSVSAFQHSEPHRLAAILADIVAGTQLGQCACELRNPQGRCCLGNVRQLLATLGSDQLGRSSMSQTPEATPVACNPQALGPEAWAAHQATTAMLFAQAIGTPHELADGYAFRFPATAFSTVAAFVEGERRCCPFFTFSVTVPPAEAAIELCITGSPEAKAVLAAELLPQGE